MVHAQAHVIDAVLITELSRWALSTQDLVQIPDDLRGWKVSVLAQISLSIDLSNMLMRTIMAELTEFERDLIRERVKSGLAAARRPWRSAGPSSRGSPSDRTAKRAATGSPIGNANQHGASTGYQTRDFLREPRHDQPNEARHRCARYAERSRSQNGGRRRLAQIQGPRFELG